MTIRPAAGSTSQDEPRPPSQPKAPLSCTAWQNDHDWPVKKSGPSPPCAFWARRQLIGAHGRGSRRRQHAAAVAQQHPREREQVIDGGDQPGGTVFERGRRAPSPVRLVPDHETVRGSPVGLRQPGRLTGPEGSIRHAQRPQDPAAEHLAVRRAGGAGQQHAEDRGAGVVHPPLARLGQQRQRPERGDPGVRVRLHGRVGWPERRQPQFVRGRHNRPRLRRQEHLQARAEPECERQQVPGGDRAGRRHGVVQRAAHLPQHLPVRQFREQPVDRLVQPDESLGHQREGGGAGNRFGGRGDPEQRVPRDRRAADRQPAERLHVHLVTAGHKGH